jgi:hypothetical protein
MPFTLNPLPIRAYVLILNELPSVIMSIILQLELILENDLTETVEPKFTISSTLKLLPKFTTLLTDKLEPQLMKLKTDVLDPSLEYALRERDEPKCVN